MPKRKRVGTSPNSRKFIEYSGRTLERMREEKASYTELLVATFRMLMNTIDGGAVPLPVARDAISMCESELFDRAATRSLSWAQDDPLRATIYQPLIGESMPPDDADRNQAMTLARKAFNGTAAPAH
ncbi:MAG: hypothetical protein RBU21_20255 [FCB group bacterium]|jgi:hypothetical protein|nr:hypothetical protein [FCB group bacterium]